MIYVYAVVDQMPRDSELVAIRAGKRGDVTPLIGAAAHIAAPPAPDESNLRAHDAIVRALWNSAPSVLPMRFGSVFPDERAARSALDEHAKALRLGLVRVRGCAQMTLRLAEGPAPDPKGGPGTRYLLARAQRQKAPEIDAIRPALEGIVREERVGRKRGVVSVFHLIPRDRVDDYRAAVGNFRAIISGPFPPYAFAPEEPA
jgi:hypothetical protein